MPRRTSPARPDFTTPEILRTSLASVILRMAALELGDIAAFPFLEPPTPRQIEDGYRASSSWAPSTSGARSRRWAASSRSLPVDPRIGRMLLAAREFNCLCEMLILASALSIQDPRDRPQDKRQESDRAHEEFRDEASDFVQLINLWKFFDEAFRHKESNRKLWADLPRALPLVRAHARVARPRRAAARDGRGPEDPRERDRRDLRAGAPRAPHRASSRTSASRRRKATTTTPRAASPSPSGRARASRRTARAGSWPGELQETTRIFARNVARVEPEWIEKAARAPGHARRTPSRTGTARGRGRGLGVGGALRPHHRRRGAR